MKDFHWFIVLGLILITPFLPALLRSKCPQCAKRKLQSLDTLKLRAEQQSSPYTYITLYRCDACRALFKQVRSGKLESSSREEHDIMAEAALPV